MRNLIPLIKNSLNNFFINISNIFKLIIFKKKIFYEIINFKKNKFCDANIYFNINKNYA